MLALAVFRHSVFRGVPEYNPSLVAWVTELWLDVVWRRLIEMLPPYVELDEEGGAECDSFGLGA